MTIWTEIKFDGWRCRVFTRNGHDYPLTSGRSDFKALQNVVRSQPERLIFMAFDLLHLNGQDLRDMPVKERRQLLEGFIEPGRVIQFSETLDGTPAKLFALAEQLELEGIVCKRRGTRYASGETINWLKVKTFVVNEYELLGVQRDPGKPTMALMGTIDSRKYLGGAFVTRPSTSARS